MLSLAAATRWAARRRDRERRDHPPLSAHPQRYRESLPAQPRHGRHTRSLPAVGVLLRCGFADLSPAGTAGTDSASTLNTKPESLSKSFLLCLPFQAFGSSGSSHRGSVPLVSMPLPVPQGSAVLFLVPSSSPVLAASTY